MQNGSDGNIVARAALHAMGREICAGLERVAASLRSGDLTGTDVAQADTLQFLTDAEGALAHANQHGLRSLIQVLRMSLQAADRCASPDEIADAAQALVRTVKSVFENLLRGDEVCAADLLPCWQRLAALGGLPEVSPASLLSLRLPSGALPPLPAAPELADPLASAEHALLLCLRGGDETERGDAVRAFAAVLATLASQAAPDGDGEAASWRVLHAYVLELAQAGGLLQVRDKKMLAATIRALRQRHRWERMAVLEPLARDALYALSMQCLQTDEGALVVRAFRVDEQLSASANHPAHLPCPDETRAGFADALARRIAELDRRADGVGDPLLWHAMADEAALSPHAAALAPSLRRFAAQVESTGDLSRQAQQAALLLGLHAWSVDAAATTADATALADLIDRSALHDPAVMQHALLRWMLAVSAGGRLAALCAAICAEMATAEQALDTACTEVEIASARSAASEVLRQVMGALAIAGLDAYCTDTAALHARLSDPMLSLDALRQQMPDLAQAWAKLSMTMALLPSLRAEAPANRMQAVDGGPDTRSCMPLMDEGRQDEQAAGQRESLQAIYFAEAGGYLGSLRQMMADPAAQGTPCEALRVAHTLAGCSATLGHTALAELAYALENYLMTATAWPDALLADTLETLERMLDKVMTSGRCEAQPALLARLQAAAAVQDSRECELPAAPPDDAARSFSEPWSTPDPDRATALTSSENDTCANEASTSASADAGCMAPVPEVASAQSSSQSPSLPDDPASDELQSIFAEEAADLLPQLEVALRSWQQQAGNHEPARQLLRVLHTLKGSARMAGRHALGDEFHQAESEVAVLAQQPSSLREQALPALQEQIDRWMQACGRTAPITVPKSAETLLPEVAASAGRGVPDVKEIAEIAEVAAVASREREAAYMPAGTDAAGTPQSADTNEAARIADATGTDNRMTAARADLPVAQPVTQLRVAAVQLARVADAAAALWVGNACINDVAQDQRHAVAALAGDLARLRAQLRELEIEAESRILSHSAQGSESGFDPLEFDRYTRLHELTRMMAESIGDLAGVQRGMTRQIERLTSSAATQARDLRQLQVDLLAMRSQPLRTIEPRLRLLLRQAARDAGVDATLVLTGGEVEVERSLLDRLAGPFGHLLRNAVVHGIEPVGERVALGKPGTGTVTIGAELAGNELRLCLQDDGRGLDLDGVRRRAIAAGLISASDEPDPAALAELIFIPGLSTAAEVSALSGRGIGMDAVRAELQSLGGRIAVDNEPGRGCRFRICIPLAMASLPVLLARAGSRRVALPAARVTQVVQPVPEQIDLTADGRQIVWQGRRLSLRHLGQALGEQVDVRADELARLPVAIVQEGERLLAFQLDAVLGQRDVMVKHPGPQLAQVPGVAGATLLGDGGIALILDLFRMPAIPLPQRTTLPERPLVLVVDDSLTVRRASQRLLERHGYAVALARDGVEALERLVERRPMALLLDIEMPRMDGFELLATLRADASLQSLPVLMITSRIADRHRERAQQLGVLGYLGKPFDEDRLLALLAGLRGETRQAA